MNLQEAVAEACKQPTLVDALSWICVWEGERAVQQAIEFKKTGISTAAHGGWDFCFTRCIEAVMAVYEGEKGLPHEKEKGDMAKKKSLTKVIASRIREVRLNKGMTTTEVAKKVGVSQAQISRLENAQQGFRSDTLEKIAKALKVRVVELVTDDPTILNAI